MQISYRPKYLLDTCDNIVVYATRAIQPRRQRGIKYSSMIKFPWLAQKAAVSILQCQEKNMNIMLYSIDGQLNIKYSYLQKGMWLHYIRPDLSERELLGKEAQYRVKRRRLIRNIDPT